MNVIYIIHLLLALAFVLCYAHQVFYVCYTMFKKPRKYARTLQNKRYAVLICAHNEVHVIGHLLDSIRRQDYPAGRVDVYVCADHCTDETAEVARGGGAAVVERRGVRPMGKGYALDALVQYIFQNHGRDAYDGYLVVDADNLLHRHYLTEMDKCFSAGHRIVVGYRGAKNFGENWLASGYALWFYREARQLNCARSLLGISGAVSGTGFLMHKDILKSLGGWPYHLMTEDVEFSADMILRGERVVYCHEAVLYDEHPTAFASSWAQRLRWARGYRQVLGRYGGRLLKGIFMHKGQRFSCFDLLMNIAPAYVLTVLATVFYVVAGCLCALSYPSFLPMLGRGMAMLFLGGYLLLLWTGVTVLCTERQRIRAGKGQKIIAVLTFPLFMMTFVLVGVVALIRPHGAWHPTQHRVSVPVDEMEK